MTLKMMNRCKLNIGRIFIVTHGPIEDDPFEINDVTEKAKSYAKWVNDNIWDLNRMQKEPNEVDVEPGFQCSHPYKCWYYDYCHNPKDTPTNE